MTLLYLDERFLEHDTGRHPECAARLKKIHAELNSSGVLSKVTRGVVTSATDSDLELVHTPEHLKTLRSFAREHGGRIEADTVMSPRSAEVAWLAAGTAVEAVTRVVQGNDATAMCLVRPPGHHALKAAPMGFCLLNNVAVAARTAVRRFGLRRVLIVDWDVHHGNGTQDIFSDDENVWFFSSHRYPFYPGTGDSSETGTGKGLGTTRNLPLKFGISRKSFLSQFEASLTSFADLCRPELVLISSGFDAHAEDPIGSLGLETQDFESLTTIVKQIAATHCNGRIVSLLEGGYNIDRLAESVQLHLSTLLKNDTGA